MLTLLTIAMATPSTGRASDDTALRLTNVSASNTSYVRIPNTTAFALQQFTIEAWVQRTGTGYGSSTDAVGSGVIAKPAEGTVGSYLGSWYLTWSNSGRAFFSVAHTAGVNGVVLQSPPVATPLGRHHLAAVVSADSVRLYVDGIPAGAAPWSLGSVFVGTNDVLIGACNFGSGFLRRLDGSIDDVRIWNLARTGDQIATSKDCRLTGNEPGLVAYYRFDALSLADDTGNGHTGAAVATAGSLAFTALTSLTNCLADVESVERSLLPSLAVSPQPTRGPLRVRFTLPRAGHVTVSAYDLAGRRCAMLAAGRYEAGDYVVDANLSLEGRFRAAAGVRFMRLEFEGQTISRTVVVVP